MENEINLRRRIHRVIAWIFLVNNLSRSIEISHVKTLNSNNTIILYITVQLF